MSSGSSQHLVPSVQTTVDDLGIATITLNVPSKLNALTEAVGDEFAATVKRLGCDPRLRVAILTGAGKAFSAGGDLQFLEDRTRDTPLRNAERMRQFYSRFLSIRSLPVPTIAAINGPAVGAGLCLAAACDMRLAAAGARLGWTFATLGIHPGMAATHFTAQILGPQMAAKLLLTGEIITGEEAARIGLVMEALPADDVLPRAHHIAAQIARASPVCVRSLTTSLRLKQDQGLEAALIREADAQSHTYASPDLLEGLRAIRERRSPVFTDPKPQSAT